MEGMWIILKKIKSTKFKWEGRKDTYLVLGYSSCKQSHMNGKIFKRWEKWNSMIKLTGRKHEIITAVQKYIE